MYKEWGQVRAIEQLEAHVETLASELLDYLKELDYLGIASTMESERMVFCKEIINIINQIRSNDYKIYATESTVKFKEEIFTCQHWLISKKDYIGILFEHPIKISLI